MRTKRKKIRKGLLALTGFMMLCNVISCVSTGIHNGQLPFSLMEKPQSKRTAIRKSGGEVEKMAQVMTYVAAENEAEFQSNLLKLQIGDVVAFYMSHGESWKHLRKGKIQKIPYELFRYGHLAMVVENPSGGHERRLLQLAMKQKVNAESGLDYLKDKNWIVFRPEKVDESKLREFVKVASERGNSEKNAYDYSGALGVKNVSDKPASKEEIAEEYTCCTLITAALYYSGYELFCTKRGGVLDIVTPKQVVESWGSVR